MALVAPISLKTRIAALGLVFALALMVRDYLQFELRRQLQAKDETVRGRKERARTRKGTLPGIELALTRGVSATASSTADSEASDLTRGAFSSQGRGRRRGRR